MYPFRPFYRFGSVATLHSLLLILCALILTTACDTADPEPVVEEKEMRKEVPILSDFWGNDLYDGIPVYGMTRGIGDTLFISAASTSGAGGLTTLRSDDGGASWTALKKSAFDFPSTPVTPIPLVIHRAESSSRLFATYQNVIRELVFSSDGGETWQDVRVMDEFRDMAPLESGNYLLVFPGSDHGTGGSWIYEDDFIERRQTGLEGDISLRRILVLESGDILAGGFSGLYSSSDNGETFSLVSDLSFIDQLSSLLEDKASNQLFAADRNNIFVSSDKGVSWSPTKLDVYRYRPLELLLSPEGVLLALVSSILEVSEDTTIKTPRRILVSLDSGETWKELGELPTIQLMDLELTTNGYVFVATLDGVYKSKLPLMQFLDQAL